MGFFDFFKRTPESVSPVEVAPSQAEQVPASKKVLRDKKEMELLLNRVKQALENISRLERDLKNNKKKGAEAKQSLADKISDKKQEFSTKFGIDYNPSFQELKKSLEDASEVSVDNTSNNTNTDKSSDASLEEPANQAGAVEQNQQAIDQSGAEEQIKEPAKDPVIDTASEPVSGPANQNTEANHSGPEQPTAASSVVLDTNPEQVSENPQAEPQVENNIAQEEGPLAPPLHYRGRFRDIKRQKAMMNDEARYTSFEESFRSLNEELSSLSDSLLSEKMSEGFEVNIQAIVDKTGLSSQEIKEIYNNHEAVIIAEAKRTTKKDVSVKKALGKAALKGGIYMGAGVMLGSAAMTLGMSGLVGAGLLAAARIIDRIKMEKNEKSQLNQALVEVKKLKNNDAGRAELKASLAAAISLQKGIQIDRTDLGSKEERIKLINDYLEDEYKYGDLGAVLGGEKLDHYKDSMVRVFEGLHEIDSFNIAQEEKAKKKGFGAILSRAEKLISGGDRLSEKNISTAVFVGLGLAAREIPVVRQVIGAVVGYRLGAMAGDYMTKENSPDASVHAWDGREIYSSLDYNAAREALLDDNLRKNNPLKYQEIKNKLDRADSRFLAEGRPNQQAANLNKGAQEELDSKISDKRIDKVANIGTRFLGAVAGVFTGSYLQDFYQSQSGKTGDTSELVKDIDATTQVEVKPEVDVVPETTPEAEAAPEADVDQKTVPESAATDADLNAEEEPAPASVDDSAASVKLFEDEISNADMKPGRSDSVWRSTAQIFKDNAEALGYEGDLDDTKALNSWVNTQTAEALNNSGDITDKVFEGNKVVLEQDGDGNYQVRVEQASGLKPSYLEKVDPAVDTDLNGDSTDPATNEAAEDAGKEIINDTKSHVTEVEKQLGAHRKIIDDFGSDLTGVKEGLNVQPDDFKGLETDGDGSGVSGEETAVEAPVAESVPSQPSDLEANQEQETPTSSEEPVSAQTSANAEQTGGQSNTNEIPTNDQVFASIDKLSSLPNGSQLQVGDLLMTKKDNVYEFINQDGQSIDMVINSKAFGQNDQFVIIKGTTVLDGQRLSEAIPMKQEIYDNLPDKDSVLAQMLLGEINANKQQAEFLSEF